MSDNWKLQVSPKLADGTLINLRAETPDEFEQIVNWATENAGKLVAVVAALNAVNAVAPLAGNTASVTVQQDEPPTYQAPQNNGGWGAPQQQAPQYSQPAHSGPTCQHGPMVSRSGTKRNDDGTSRSWSGWFCPTPKGTPGQCPPKFNKG